MASIDFVDDRDGCLFTATVHRKPIEEPGLIGSVTSSSANRQKASGKSANVGKELGKRRESAKASGKSLGTVGKEPKKRRESAKTSGKILEMCRERPSIKISELAGLIGVTERSIQRNIQKLQADKLLRRIGGRKAGYWEVVDNGMDN
jgi:ATP-dependent DNA helicase RecG